jgi:feruloyl-CoA synthase
MFTGPLMTPAAHIGVPVLGLELKATPVDGRLEARIKGPNVTPGYWRDEARTRASFDEDGYYRMGDAIAPIDANDLSRGFVFEGRLTEDFKLSTGTWVRVGTIRARLLALAGDLVQDVVVTGHERDEVGALFFINVSGCRALLGDTRASLVSLIAHPQVREAIAQRVARYNHDHPGSSTAVARTALLETPPSIDAMEITDKGSINQRAVLRHRAALVERLYAQ